MPLATDARKPYFGLVASATKYGITITKGDFSERDCLLWLEMEAIRRGGNWERDGQKQGLGMTAHYLNFHRICWPDDQQHRWFKLGMAGICENKTVCLLGCASSGKTYLMASHALITFWCFPNTSFALISSNTIESLKSRMWGRGIAFLFNRGKKIFPWLAGYVLESRLAILTDEVDEEGELARQTANGIRCVPCTSGSKFIGMARFQGIKPPNSPGKNDGKLSHYGDEAATMETSYLDAYTNWMVSPNFKGVQAGNPTDIGDPLCTASEPVGGWDVFIDSGSTQTWRSKWYDTFCIAFDGRDTPNNDSPKDQFPFLAPSTFVGDLTRTHGEDSWQLWQQGIGKPSRGMVSNRVITIGLCERHKAFDGVIWMGTKLTKIGHVDPAYGGGDRCVWMESVFGEDQNGVQIFSAGSPEIIPIKMNCGRDAEDQIAEFMFRKHESQSIPAENIFYDSFGRGTLGNALAKYFGSKCPVPVDSGAKCTARPVRFDLHIEDGPNKMKRLKRCDEHYSKFVTEMWFSVREVIESDQMRGLSRPVAEEGQSRMYCIVAGNKIEVESKDDMKERIRKSPDLMDCTAIGVEGARRLGFQIRRIGKDVVERLGDSEQWLRDMARKRDKQAKAKQLAYA